ncbi:cell cycle checkpoint protein RAD17 isoform X4 [Parasteatoda tepidariorum]|uniref:cell cycle checkpoint protein RAD17 isoform X4 n=1 Tax=Parasteatoda tepidariorum TaxID=114398 RepID=UPI001C71C44C|nr:cell cycle checkpoint protein RAD17-like isoform X4 [Parasteatoda tepidariorum]
MVSKGTSLKRKHKDLFQGGNDNSEHYSTWVEEFSPTNVVFLFNHTSVRKGDLLNICFLIIWPLSKGSHYCQLLAEELAIHKKKVSEVQVWIQTATNKQNKECFLILSGPPGVGKTATVKALSKSLDIELFTWSNKHQENAKNTYDGLFCFGDQIATRETQAQSFSRFLLQSSKYFLYSNGKRIILIEEFPNAFIRDPTLLHCILRYLTVKLLPCP